MKWQKTKKQISIAFVPSILLFHVLVFFEVILVYSKSIGSSAATCDTKGTRFFCFSQNRQPHTRDQRPKKKLSCSVLGPNTRG